MKRCPECEFLYENESKTCDMDGTPLRFTATLPALPGFARTVCDKWTIALVCAVVLGTVLVILYRATPRAFTSSSPRSIRSANDRTLPKNEATDAPIAEPQPSSTDESDTSTQTDEALQSPSALAKKQKAKLSTAPTDETEPAPAVHLESIANSQIVKSSAANPVTTESNKQAAEASGQKPALATSATTIHPKPADTTSNKINSQDQKKDSGFKSMLKKAGKVLKKPFGEN